MTKQEYKELTGENPEDMFGGDWENIIDDLEKPSTVPCNFMSCSEIPNN